MSLSVTHNKTLAIPDGADTTIVRPSDWNATHTITGLGTGVQTALETNTGSAGSVVVNGGAGGTPSSITLTNGTGLPIATGVSGLGSGIATFLATPSSANLRAAITDETGSGAAVFGTSPSITTPSFANSMTFTGGMNGASLQWTTSVGKDYLQWYMNGTTSMALTSAGNSAQLFLQKDNGQFGWSGSAQDTAISRAFDNSSTSPVGIEINSWTLGDRRDLLVRGLRSNLHTRSISDFSKTSDTTLANVPGLQVNVRAGGLYQFRAELYTTSGTSGGVKFAVGGTATATSITYDAMVYDGGAVSAQGRATSIGTAVGGVTAVSAAKVVITGTIQVNAAGTLTIQFAQNASNGTSSVVKIGSVFIADPFDPLNLVCAGDSIMANMSTDLGTNGLKVYNYALPGSILANLVSQSASPDAITFNYPAFMCLVGHNDIGSVGYNETTFVNSLQTYLLARQAVGKKVFVCTVLPSTLVNFNTTRASLNTALKTMIAANGFVLMDIGDTGTTMGADAAASDTSLYSDGIHPTAAGNTHLYNDVIIPALQAEHYR